MITDWRSGCELVYVPVGSTTGKRLDFLLSTQTDRISTASVTLDGRAYAVTAQLRRWDRAWMISLATAGGAPILDCATANNGEDLLGSIVVTGRPPGRLLVRDTSGRNRDPGI